MRLRRMPASLRALPTCSCVGAARPPILDAGHRASAGLRHRRARHHQSHAVPVTWRCAFGGAGRALARTRQPDAAGLDRVRLVLGYSGRHSTTPGHRTLVPRTIGARWVSCLSGLSPTDNYASATGDSLARPARRMQRLPPHDAAMARDPMSRRMPEWLRRPVDRSRRQVSSAPDGRGCPRPFSS